MNYEEALARLDDEQRHVASWRPTDRNLRIQATAGSGKTTTLVALAATLLRAGAWPAAQLVLTTFSRKAADEIIKRVGDLVDPTGIQMNTWHGLGLRVLRQLEPAKWNIRRCIELPIKQRAKDVPSSIQLWRDVVGWWDIAALGRKGLKLDKGLGDILDRHRLDMAEGRRLEHGETNDDPLAYLEAWTLYEQLKKKLNLWDWDDVLYAWQDRLHARERPHPLVVLVDEAQDNSWLQLDIAQRLASHPDGRLVLVGDSRQAIHTWRGAYPQLFIEAETRLGAETRYLHRTYRCPRRVTHLANALVADQPWADGPVSSAFRDIEGVTTFRNASPVEEVTQRVEGGEAPDRFAILARTNADVGNMALRLLASGVNTRVLGGGNILKSPVAQTLLAWAQVAEAPTEEAWMQVYRTPGRYLRKTWAGSVWQKVAGGMGLVEAMEHTPSNASGLYQLICDVEKVEKITSLAKRLDYIAHTILGLEKVANLTASSPNRRRNEEKARDDRVAGALIDLAGTFPTLDAFHRLEEVATDTKAPSVTLSTMHKAKGLEWPIVYVCAEAGKVPHTQGDPDEELRLFYVAVTRAQDELHCLYDEAPSPYIVPHLGNTLEREHDHHHPSPPQGSDRSSLGR